MIKIGAHLSTPSAPDVRHVDIPPGFAASDATLAYHLNQLCQLILFGILVELDRDPSLACFLTGEQKDVLKAHVYRFLGSLSAEEVEHGINSVENLGDHARDFLSRYGGPVNVVITALLRKAG